MNNRQTRQQDIAKLTKRLTSIVACDLGCAIIFSILVGGAITIGVNAAHAGGAFLPAALSAIGMAAMLGLGVAVLMVELPKAIVALFFRSFPVPLPLTLQAARPVSHPSFIPPVPTSPPRFIVLV